MNITARNAKSIDRRTPFENRSALTLESFKKEFGEYTRYIITALKSIDKAYTDKLIEQGNRVENQLRKRLEIEYPELEFRRQGSVANNTHIRYSSDVDLLVIIDKFHTLESPLEASSPYLGNTVTDLLELRKDCKKELRFAFPEADIDDQGANSLEISGGTLYCKVDVVPANWFDTIKYRQTYQEFQRGIQILNKKEMERKTNYPFLFNELLHQNDKARNGIPKMLIRLQKTIKADETDEGNKINFSSYDIASIVYRMPDNYFNFNIKSPLEFIYNLLMWQQSIIQNINSVQSQLMVVDDSRLIFDKDDKISEFQKLFGNLLKIYNYAKAENNDQVVLTEKHLY